MNTPHKVLPTDAPAVPARRTTFQVIMAELESPTTTLGTFQPPIANHPSTVASQSGRTAIPASVLARLRRYRREILKRYGSRECPLVFHRRTIDDFMESERAKGMTDTELLLLYREIAYHQVVEKAEYDPYRILSLFFKTMMGYVDLATDVATMAYYATVKPMVAAVQGGILAFSFVCQCVFSIACGQPLWVGLMGLIGMKPALEAWRDATGAEVFKGQKMGNDFILWSCRMMEMVVSAGVG